MTKQSNLMGRTMKGYLLKEGFVPYYHQIREHITRAIKNGDLKPGEPVLSERELCQRYQVSRMTVRKTLDILVNDGLIYRLRGKGTFVSRPIIEHPPQIISFTEEMEKRGLKAKSRVLEARLIRGDKVISGTLAIPLKEDAAVIKRLRMVNNEPVALETSYLPHKLYPEILKQNLTGSLTRITEEKYGLTLHRAEQIVRADMASKEEANLLKVKHGSAVLKVRRTSFLQDNRVAEYLEATYAGDKYELKMELKGRWKRKQQ